MLRWLLAMCVTGLAAAAIAQPAPPARPPAPTPKPGYVVPPENSAGLYPVSGEPIFKQRCASCHDPATDERTPTKAQLEGRSPEEVYDALTVGAMKPMATGLTDAQLYGITRFLTGKSPTPQANAGPDPNVCAKHGPLQPNGPQWNGWGRDLENSRYQPNPGFRTADVGRLKVKWAFAYPGTKNSEPLIFGDRVFAASMAGKVYALDAASGCVHWRYDFRGGARASMTVGKNARAPSGWALYVGDDRMVVHALDAGSGKALWTLQTNTHKVGRITGSPALYRDVLYVPLSASEESQGNVGAYGCCTFIGTVVAVDAIAGKVKWSSSILGDTQPKPTRKNAAGTQMYGPAGGAIWSAPTIDAKRGQLYVATGDSYTEIDHPTSDAVVAMDLATGKIRWVNQVLANDNFMSGTINGPLGRRGPDFDFGSSPQLIKAGGRELLVTGNKSSIVFAMDPDTGKMVWETPKLGAGSAAGGVQWGPATDGKRVYAGLAEPRAGRPGLVALDVASGKEVWRVDAPKGLPCNVPSGRCTPGVSMAVTAIPGAVFAGHGDGRLRAYAAADGKVLWEVDTTEPRDTINGVKGAPGGYLDMGGPTIAGGRLFVHSGYNGSAGASNLLLAFTVDGK